MALGAVASGAVALGAVALLVASSGVLSIVIAVLLLAYARIISPAFFPRSADLQVALERTAAGQAPLVFCKPGCVFCIRAASGGRLDWWAGVVGRQLGRRAGQGGSAFEEQGRSHDAHGHFP